MTTKTPQEEALAAVLGGMLKASELEREKTEPYKEMFKAGSSYTGLLRELKSKGMRPTLDAAKVLQDMGAEISDDLFEFLIALPYLAYKLQRHIDATEGMCCCADKTFFLLSAHLKQLATPEVKT